MEGRRAGRRCKGSLLNLGQSTFCLGGRVVEAVETEESLVFRQGGQKRPAAVSGLVAPGRSPMPARKGGPKVGGVPKVGG